MAERRRMSCEERLRLPASSESTSRSTGGSTEVTKLVRAEGFGCRAACAATWNGTDSNSVRPNGTAPSAEAGAPWRVARER